MIEEDQELRATQQQADSLRNQRKSISKEIGKLMSQGKKEEAAEVKSQVAKIAEDLETLSKREDALRQSVLEK